MVHSLYVSGPESEPPEIDTSVPNSARIWNYWLGGKDNYPVDRLAGDEYRAIYPEIVDVARASRQFLGRAVRFLAGEAQVRQFLDIGTGLPTFNTTHEVAERVTPDVRVVYVDNDPVVLAHARALLTSTRAVTAFVDADLRDPDRILATAAETLDLTRPIGLMLLGILGHIDDDDQARSIVAQLVGAVPSGSYLTVCDGTNDLYESGVEAQRRYNESGAAPTGSAARRRSPASSRGWSSSSPAWCPVRGGGPTPAGPAALSPRDGPVRGRGPQALSPGHG